MGGERTVIAALTDLMFRVKIAEAAKRGGQRVVFVGDAAALLREVRNRPDTIVLDLDCAAIDPVETIRQLKADSDVSVIPIVGYVSHVHAERIAAAQEAGCDKILARSAFVQKIEEVLNGERLMGR